MTDGVAMGRDKVTVSRGIGQHTFHLGVATTAGAATRGIVYFFSGGMGQDLFHLGVGTMGGVDTERSGNVRGHFSGMVNDSNDDDSFDLDMGTDEVVAGRNDHTISWGMGGDPLNLSLGRDEPTVSGGMGVAPLNLSMGRDNATVCGGWECLL